MDMTAFSCLASPRFYSRILCVITSYIILFSSLPATAGTSVQLEDDPYDPHQILITATAESASVAADYLAEIKQAGDFPHWLYAGPAEHAYRKYARETGLAVGDRIQNEYFQTGTAQFLTISVTSPYLTLAAAQFAAANYGVGLTPFLATTAASPLWRHAVAGVAGIAVTWLARMFLVAAIGAAGIALGYTEAAAAGFAVNLALCVGPGLGFMTVAFVEGGKWPVALIAAVSACLTSVIGAKWGSDIARNKILRSLAPSLKKFSVQIGTSAANITGTGAESDFAIEMIAGGAINNTRTQMANFIDDGLTALYAS